MFAARPLRLILAEKHLTMKSTTTKCRYKVTNWKEYNQSLCKRGSITLWITDDIADTWYYQGKRAPGGELLYTDKAIELCLTLRAIYGLGYRQTEGYVKSLFSLAAIDLQAPSYSQMQRRSARITIGIKTKSDKKGAIDIVIDSTGLKVYGEGEWKVRKHGKDKNRTWRKVHIASDPADLEIVWVKVTGNDIDDASAGMDMPDGIGQSIKSCAGDGAYDKKKFRGCLPKDVQQLIPPQKNAVKSKKHAPLLKQRDEAIARIQQVGRKQWKKEVGYHKRSLSEVNMYRYKKIFTGALKARKPRYETSEVRIKCKILNKFAEIGMPITIKIAA